MSSKWLLTLIDKLPSLGPLERAVKLVEETDPDRIYVEQIRAFFHLPRAIALWLCEQAVKQGIFEKRVGYLSPDSQRLLYEEISGIEVPDYIEDVVAQAEDSDRFRYRRDECQKIEFYKLLEA